MRYFITLLLLCILEGCNNKCENTRIIRAMKEGLHLQQNYDIGYHGYTVYRYIKPKTCNSCELQMGRWKIFKRKMELQYGDNINFRFVIDTNKYDEINKLLKRYKFSECSYIDTVGEFISNNKYFSDLGNDITMLIDSTGSILLMGDPCKSAKISSLYNQIINNEI